MLSRQSLTACRCFIIGCMIRTLLENDFGLRRVGNGKRLAFFRPVGVEMGAFELRCLHLLQWDLETYRCRARGALNCRFLLCVHCRKRPQTAHRRLRRKGWQRSAHGSLRHAEREPTQGIPQGKGRHRFFSGQDGRLALFWVCTGRKFAGSLGNGPHRLNSSSTAATNDRCPAVTVDPPFAVAARVAVGALRRAVVAVEALDVVAVAAVADVMVVMVESREFLCCAATFLTVLGTFFSIYFSQYAVVILPGFQCFVMFPAFQILCSPT